MARMTADGAIVVEGLQAFRDELQALGNKKLTAELRRLNYEASRTLAVATKLRMAGSGRWADNEAAKEVRAQRSLAGGQVVMGPITFPDGRTIPATGIEFGAYQNRRRFIKNTGSRATILRDGEDADRIRARVERNFVDARGRTRAAREDGARQVKVVRMVVGWNQFKPWRGNKTGAGYYLFPALRDLQDHLATQYLSGLDALYAKAFPDRTAA